MRAVSLLVACVLVSGAIVYAQDREPPESSAPTAEEVRRVWTRKLELEKSREPPEPTEEDFKRAEKEGRIKEFVKELERKWEECHAPDPKRSAEKARVQAAFLDLFKRADWTAFDTKTDGDLLRQGLWQNARRALNRDEGATARRAFEAYALRFPDGSPPSLSVAKAVLLSGEVEEAIRRLEGLLTAEAAEETRAETLIALGDARLVAGDRAGARKAWKEAGESQVGKRQGIHLPTAMRSARVRVGYVGRDAPPLEAEEVIGGEAPTWAGLKGKVVVVQAFSSGCRACRGVMPHLLALLDRHPEGDLVVLGLTVVESDGFLPAKDTPDPFWIGEDVTEIAPKDFRAHLETFRERIGIDYPWLVQRMAKAVAWNAWDPHPVVVVGRDGKIAFAQVGGGEISSVLAVVSGLLSTR